MQHREEELREPHGLPELRRWLESQECQGGWSSQDSTAEGGAAQREHPRGSRRAPQLESTAGCRSVNACEENTAGQEKNLPKELIKQYPCTLRAISI